MTSVSTAATSLTRSGIDPVIVGTSLPEENPDRVFPSSMPDIDSPTHRPPAGS
ncbi:hypothetical protein Afe04nite_22260 [Asanoa ferruginea]|nr:hypothetical protein Afe04nite_22260 [Asanoa ferruginea]